MARTKTYSVGRRAGVLALPLSAALVAGISPAASAQAAVARTGAVVRPASFTAGGILNAVAATSARNAWAVGQTEMLPGGSKTLIAHWNGAVWRRVPGPTTAAGAGLEGVAATSARDAWAVGCTSCLSSGQRSLIEHWNGTAWQRVPNLKGAVRSSILWGVAATSARNAWAVGFTGGPPKTVILRWNGSVWRRVPSPNPPGGGVLIGVAATSAISAWAVGYSTGAAQHTLILYWNGTAWKQVRSPILPVGSANLYAVAATSAGNAWAVGCALCFGNRPQTLIERWNGTAWKRVPSPSPSGRAQLYGVAARSASAGWAVGFTGPITDETPRPVILGWNGVAWKQMASPNIGSASLTAVAVMAGRAWAVGQTGSYYNLKPKTVVLRWNGSSWERQ